MLDLKNIVVFGYSGHSYVVIETMMLNGFRVSGYIDHKENILNPFNIDYLGSEKNKEFELRNDNYFVFPAIGSNEIRRSVVSFFDENKLKQTVLIHPNATISSQCEIDNSTVINAGVILNALVSIGKGCIINTSSIIEHECILEQFVHVAPGAVLAGGVSVGEGTFIGANSVLKQGLEIGSNVIIGAGSVVLNNVPNNEVWVGNPAKRIR